MLASKIAMAAAGLGGQTYVEDVFSAYTYTGDGATPTITNGLAMSGGSMVWIKNRDAADSHVLVDTTRGVGQILSTNTTAADTADADTVTAFSSTGFTLGADVQVNTSTEDYVAWSFRQADNFFFENEVTKVASTSKTVDLSSLGTVGMVAVKRTDSTGSWYVWHKDLTAGKLLIMETTAAEATLGHITVSGTTLTLVDGVIADGDYIVYAWGHAVAAFGADSDQDIIQCGTFTGASAVVDLGWEPQYLLIRPAQAVDNWYMMDVFRGWTATLEGRLYANTTDAEAAGSTAKINSTGFTMSGWYGTPTIYMAIRRPMKVPEAGTEVFSPTTRLSNGVAYSITGTGFPPDLFLATSRDKVISGTSNYLFPRLTNGYMISNGTSAEAGNSGQLDSFDMDGVSLATSAGTNNYSGNTYLYYMFKRAPEFMDVVCYTGTGSAHTEAHNLGAVPELMIVKSRSATSSWNVYTAAFGPTHAMSLNNGNGSSGGNGGLWNSTSPTDSVFSLGTASGGTNDNAVTYVAYLFATLAGISKVGTYTGTAADLDLDMGFAAGARFFLCKRTDSTGDWYVFDSERGIVAGNDPYLLLNSTAAEVTGTDFVDPYSPGLTLTAAGSATINISSADYIYLAIA